MCKGPGTDAIYFWEFCNNVFLHWFGVDPKTLIPTKNGGILPRVRYIAAAVEEDGNASLHLHCLVWSVENGSFEDNFNTYIQCAPHRKDTGYRNPTWKYGFYDATQFDIHTDPEVLCILAEENKIVANIKPVPANKILGERILISVLLR